MTAVPVPPAPDYEKAIYEAMTKAAIMGRVPPHQRPLSALAEGAAAAIRPLVAAEVAAERERIAQRIEAAPQTLIRWTDGVSAWAYRDAVRIAREAP